MAKQTISATIDSEIAEAFELKFPRQRSKMIQNYMALVLGIESNNKTIAKKQELESEITSVTKVIRENEIMLQTLALKLNKVNQEQEKEQNEFIAINKNNYFDLSRQEKDKIIASRDNAIDSKLVEKSITVVDYYAKHWIGGSNESN